MKRDHSGMVESTIQCFEQKEKEENLNLKMRDNRLISSKVKSDSDKHLKF